MAYISGHGPLNPVGNRTSPLESIELKPARHSYHFHSYSSSHLVPSVGTLSEDRFSTNGFDWHPHRGIETITVVLEGELEHHDSRGGHGVLKPGDVQ